MELEYSGQDFEKYSILKSMKNRPVEAEVFHASRRAGGRADWRAGGLAGWWAGELAGGLAGRPSGGQA
jgi:hypothetical protein